MKKNHKCYIYTRVSTAIQVDEYSLDAQKDKLRKYAEYQEKREINRKNRSVGTYQRKRAAGSNSKFMQLKAYLR